MAGSRLTDDGHVVVTTPATWCEVGHELRVVGSAATYGVSHADWALRLLLPTPTMPATANYSVAASERLLEALEAGVVHESLVAEPDVDVTVPQ